MPRSCGKQTETITAAAEKSEGTANAPMSFPDAHTNVNKHKTCAATTRLTIRPWQINTERPLPVPAFYYAFLGINSSLQKHLALASNSGLASLNVQQLPTRFWQTRENVQVRYATLRCYRLKR